MDYHHISVLPQETMKYLQPDNGFFIDCTFGGGGHTRNILETNTKNEVLALDCDETAIKNGTEKLKEFKNRLSFYHINFRNIDKIPKEIINERPIKGILMDIGVSSHHFDTANRGFSYRTDAPLDMRMDKSQSLTASTIVNTWSEKELNEIIRVYGEEKHHKIIVKAIISHRKKQPWQSTKELANMIDKILRRWKKTSLPSPTKTFQALRIAVNDEINALEEGLEKCFQILSKNGRLVVISFHSLEDRVVKKYFRKLTSPTTNNDPFAPNKEETAEAELLTNKVITSTEQEINKNSRALSAKLRAIQKR